MSSHSTITRLNRRNSQRERLIAGMVTAVDRHGYKGANVTQVIANAAVSRPTFYEYFRDKEDCFLATHGELGHLLLSEIREATFSEAPQRAVQTAIRRLVELAEAHPSRANLLVNQAMAGGRRSLAEHDRLIDEIVSIIEDRLDEAPADAPAPDLPIHAVLGAGRWLLAPALRRGKCSLVGIAEDLNHWVEHYLRPSAERRWRKLVPGPELPLSPYVVPLAIRQLPSVPPGRPKLSKREIAENQRERILHATAETVALKGYTVTTVADITMAAKIDRRIFYRHFRNKQQAFLAVHDFGLQQMMAVAAGAFFSVSDWPDRIWEAMKASMQFETANPVISHIGYVDSHAVGAPAIQRVEDTRSAFTIFLQEGDGYTSQPLSYKVRDAVAGAVFEIHYRQMRLGRSDTIARLVPAAVYLVLAPFVGAQRATELVDAKLGQQAPA